MAHARAAADRRSTEETGIARLVAAERRWKDIVERAEADARQLLADTRAAEAAADAALEQEIARLLATRAAATRAAMHERCEAHRRQADERAARYDGAGADAESRIAREIADRLWGGPRPVRHPAGEGA